MAQTICPHCGHPLRLQGLAAICPHCGELVMSDAPPSPGRPRQDDSPPIPLVAEDPPMIAAPPPTRPPLPRAMPPVYATAVPVIPLQRPADPQSDSTAAGMPVEEPGYDLPPLPPPDPESEVSPAPLPAEAALATAGEEPVEWNPLLIGASIVGGVIVILLTVVLLLVFRPGGAVPPPPTPIRAPSTYVPPPLPQIAAAPQTAPVLPPEPPATVPVVRPPPPHAALARLTPTSQPLPGLSLTDQEIGDSITRGINYLLPTIYGPKARLSDFVDAAALPGGDSLAVYALINAGLAVGDERLNAHNQITTDLLDRLKAYPIIGSRSTYSHSLRISALSVFHRPQDKAQIEADHRWLVTADVKGAYTYDVPSPEVVKEGSTSFADNSNSQYGALGVWAAANAGVVATPAYWGDIERYWSSAQNIAGGWGYHARGNSTLSMTAAGLTMLFVARDQMSLNSPPSNNYFPLTKQQQAALAWLADGNNAVDLSNAFSRGYTLYGLERAGLACGYKYFGQHDWYSELAADTIKQQSPDGSWSGNAGNVAETAFNLLFLSRGRHPVFMAKLRFDGAWQNRPRDLEVLTRFASDQLERPLNWQIADIEHDWWAWSDAPTVLLSSNKAFTFTDEQAKKLREFALAGGLIFCNTEKSSAETDESLDALAKRIFPEWPMTDIPPEHPIYSLVYQLTDPPPLRGVSNGSRLLLVHSPKDLARWWQPFPPKSERVFSQLAINVGVYATGQRDLRNRLSTNFVPQPPQAPIGTVPLARLQYDGPWDPEPAAWPRAGRQLQIDTGFALDLRPTRLAELKFEDCPIAHLTGLQKFTVTDADTAAVREFLHRGGTLIIDACGGNAAFANFVGNELLPKLAPNQSVEAMADDSPLRRVSFPGMTDLKAIKLRPDLPGETPNTLYQLNVDGGGFIIFSRLDLTTGLLGSNTAGIVGYAPRACQELVENGILWTLAKLPKS